ncbi:BlaI/MecI/CopY family transcriptional regulator [Symmachiella dynata]|uniref:BlaI/MecI/CopY family transcriptional regulator n=1 Tax=Symmachiella dynata TaxID=2527995 RepID=UPI0030EE29DD
MKSLTPGELEVMQVLWQHGSLKPAEILEHVERPLTNPALRSVLRVLMDKGHVTRKKQGKAFYYSAKNSAPTAFKKMTQRLAEIFCSGSSVELIAQLIKNENLSEEEVRQLQELAQEKVADPSPPRKSRRRKS